MLFCTTDEQIESFILPFQGKGGDACADQHAASVGGTDPGPPHLLEVPRCRQQEVIIAER